MYYAPLPLPILIFAIVAFICYLRKSGPKKKRRLMTDRKLKFPKTNREKIEKVIDCHRDCASIVYEIWVSDSALKDITIRHIPGDPVSLGFKNDSLAVFIDGVFIATIYNSKLSSIVSNEAWYEAYIYKRDEQASSPNYMDFLSIIVFYRE